MFFAWLDVYGSVNKILSQSELVNLRALDFSETSDQNQHWHPQSLRNEMDVIKTTERLRILHQTQLISY